MQNDMDAVLELRPLVGVDTARPAGADKSIIHALRAAAATAERIVRAEHAAEAGGADTVQSATRRAAERAAEIGSPVIAQNPGQAAVHIARPVRINTASRPAEGRRAADIEEQPGQHGGVPTGSRGRQIGENDVQITATGDAERSRGMER